MIIFDLDDFAGDSRSMDDLERLCEMHVLLPTLKVTLFTIPESCSVALIDGMRQTFPWIDLVQHGWSHSTNYECLNWTKQDCKCFLRCGRDKGLTTKGFKAPGWQISNGCYDALLEDGYWVADQRYNDGRRPPELPSYCIREGVGIASMGTKLGGLVMDVLGQSIHGHIGHLGGYNPNALELIHDHVLLMGQQDANFRFISEVMG